QKSQPGSKRSISVAAPRDQARQKVSGWREPVVLLARSLILMPRCQLKITGRTWPAMGQARCIAAVKVETSSSPGAGVAEPLKTWVESWGVEKRALSAFSSRGKE